MVGHLASLLAEAKELLWAVLRVRMKVQRKVECLDNWKVGQ